MSEPKFAKGDLVRHRASGERAVVLEPNCVRPHSEDCPCTHPFGALARCTCTPEEVFSGSYSVSVNFSYHPLVEEIELELAQ
jgi:hypothetical protein